MVPVTTNQIYLSIHFPVIVSYYIPEYSILDKPILDKMSGSALRTRSSPFLIWRVSQGCRPTEPPQKCHENGTACGFARQKAGFKKQKTEVEFCWRFSADFFGSTYPLVMSKKLLKMTIEIVDFPINSMVDLSIAILT